MAYTYPPNSAVSGAAVTADDINDLRDNVDDKADPCGKGPYFSGAHVSAGSQISAQDINDLRNAVKDLYRDPSGTEYIFGNTIDETASPGDAVRAAHIQDIRDALEEDTSSIPGCCLGNGSGCSADSECCSNICAGGTCQANCEPCTPQIAGCPGNGAAGDKCGTYAPNFGRNACGNFCAPDCGSCTDPNTSCSPAVNGTCVLGPTCTDRIQNQDETDVDCGGATCPACATCSDGEKNQDETDVDCGGATCPACPGCTDGSQNGTETGVDCGGSCPPCCGNGVVGAGEQCEPPGTPTCSPTCQNIICGNGVLEPPGEGCEPPDTPSCNASCQNIVCGDGVKEGAEQCDGTDGAPEGDASCCQNCAIASFCPPTCTDGQLNGQETDRDCGGPVCPACPPACEYSSQAQCNVATACGAGDGCEMGPNGCWLCVCPFNCIAHGYVCADGPGPVACANSAAGCCSDGSGGCTCEPWEDIGCGTDCNPQKLWTRTCNPPGCDAQSKCEGGPCSF